MVKLTFIDTDSYHYGNFVLLCDSADKMKKEQNKGFICRLCGQKHYTTDVRGYRCKRCHKYICPSCQIDEYCVDCFVNVDTKVLMDYDVVQCVN